MIPHRYVEVADKPHYVYRIYDSVDRLLYVGCTIHPVSRLSQHRSWISHWLFMEGRDEEFRSVVSDPTTCYDAYTEEARAIREEDPAYNVARGHVFHPDITSQEELEAWINDPLQRALRESIRVGATSAGWT